MLFDMLPYLMKNFKLVKLHIIKSYLVFEVFHKIITSFWLSNKFCLDHERLNLCWRTDNFMVSSHVRFIIIPQGYILPSMQQNEFFFI